MESNRTWTTKNLDDHNLSMPPTNTAAAHYQELYWAAQVNCCMKHIQAVLDGSASSREEHKTRHFASEDCVHTLCSWVSALEEIERWEYLPSTCSVKYEKPHLYTIRLTETSQSKVWYR
jgi:hypothetical protein